jgi:Glycosyl transferase family 2
MGLSCAIVISNYNYARYLAQAVDSALATRAIVVVVDDGSTDDSWNVLARYGDRVTTLRQESRGQAGAINAGVAAADADVLLLLDPYDVVLPNRIDRVADVFRAVDVEWVRHDMLYFDQRGTDGLAYRFSAAADPTREFRCDRPSCRIYVRPRIPQSVPRSVGPIPESVFRICADLFLLAAESIAGGAITFAEPLTLRRRHPEQATRRVPPSRGLETILSEMQQNAELAKHASHLARKFGTLPEVAAGEAWWQRKWTFDQQLFMGDRNDALAASRSVMRALARAPLPASRMAAEACRSTLLALTPRSALPRPWWATHTGRSRRMHTWARALTRSQEG